MVFQTKGKLSAKTHQLSETERSRWTWPGCPCGEAWESGGPFLLFERISILGDWDAISLKRWKVNSNSGKNKKKLPETRRSSFRKYKASFHRRAGEASRWGQSRRMKPEPGGPRWACFSHFRVNLGLLPCECASPHGAHACTGLSPPGAPGLS